MIRVCALFIMWHCISVDIVMGKDGFLVRLFVHTHADHIQIWNWVSCFYCPQTFLNHFPTAYNQFPTWKTLVPTFSGFTWRENVPPCVMFATWSSNFVFRKFSTSKPVLGWLLWGSRTPQTVLTTKSSISNFELGSLCRMWSAWTYLEYFQLM